MASMEDRLVAEPDPNEDLRGSLARTSIGDVLQFLHAGGRTGELAVTTPDRPEIGRAYLSNGHLMHVSVGETRGVDGLMELLAWHEGAFRFSSDVLCPTVTIDMPMQAALVEAARRLDERLHSEPPPDPREVIGDHLERFVSASEVMAAFYRAGDDLVARTADGAEVDLEALTTGLAAVLAGIEELGRGMKSGGLRELVIEFEKHEVMTVPVAAGRLVVVAASGARMGVVRHRTKQLAADVSLALGEPEL